MVNQNDTGSQAQLDQAKKIEFGIALLDKTQKFKDTTFVYLARALYFAKKHGTVDIENNTALTAIARTSRAAAKNNTKDGGSEGYLMKLKKAGLKLCHSIKTISRVEQTLEELGVVEVIHNGHGLVCELHVNLRSAALLLELLHPSFDDNEELCLLHAWIKPFCDKILGRGFNRKDPDAETYDDEYLSMDLEFYHDLFPARRFNLNQVTSDILAMFNRFCRGVRRNLDDCIIIQWDIDISNPPNWDEYA